MDGPGPLMAAVNGHPGPSMAAITDPPAVRPIRGLAMAAVDGQGPVMAAADSLGDHLCLS